MRLLLRGLRIADVGCDERADLRLAGRRIVEIGRGLAPRRRERVVELVDHLALPGLINAHDHLDLDLLPWLGAPPYAAFADWARDVHRPDEPPVREMLRVPARMRFAWGGLRNLISGATTVAHHGALPRLPISGSPVRLVRRAAWSHSLGFSADLARDHRRARGRPFAVHAAEGTDESSHEEVGRLADLGVLAPGTVLVHAIAAGREVGRLAAAGVGVVWCPGSNLRLYGATAPVDRLLAAGVPVALGTDSTMSGEATLLDELRVARDTGLATPAELLAMVTTVAAELFRLRDRGRLVVGAAADLLVLPDAGGPPAERLLAARPADLRLVVVRGRPGLADPERAETLELGPPNAFLDGAPVWLATDVGRTKRRISGAGGVGVTGGVLWSRIEPGGAEPSAAVARGG